MKSRLVVAAAAMAALMTGPSSAANNLFILPAHDLANIATITAKGDGNRLVVVQENSDASNANRLSISIEGDFNGGPLGASFSGAATLNGLAPGTISQIGFGNSINMAVLGSHNLFAVSQAGNGNAVSASIAGSHNQASVLQVGNNNFAGFSQTGFGNIVSITQTSW